MKLKRTKKGFTIIELVIVIAVIGILAAVLIPTFVNLTNKANEAADNALVNNLNKALKMEEQEPGHQKAPTLEGAIQDLEDQGYLLENLASKSGKDLLWSQSENQFLLNTEGKSGKDYWKIVDAMPAEENQKYSYYAGKNFKDTNVTAKYGFDAGRNDGIAKVTYKGTGSAQEVAIRTNGESLDVNAPTDTVKHYGESEDVNIIAVDKNNSFHEFGRVAGAIKLTAGRYVAEAGSEATTVVIDATSYTNIEVSIKEGSSVGALIDFNNVVPAAISDSFEYVVTSDDTENTVEEILASVAYIENDFIKTYYDNLQEALDDASNGETVVLTNDISAQGSGAIFTYRSTTEDREATLDLNGKIIIAKLENTESCQVFNIGSANGDNENYQHTATLTLKDSNAPLHGHKTGAVIAVPDRYSDSWKVAVSAFSVTRLGNFIVDSGKILVEGEDVVISASADNPYCIDVLTNTGVQDASLTISGGYIASNMSTGVGVRAFCNSSTGTVNITMNGGYVFGDSRAFMLQYPSNNVKCNLNCVINGGILESATRALDVLNFNSSAIADSEFNITVNGGTYISHNDTDKVKFPGSDILYISWITNVTAHINFTDNR